MSHQLFFEKKVITCIASSIFFSLRKTIFFCITRKKIKIKRDISAKWYTVTTDTIDMLFKQTQCPLFCYFSTRFCLHGKFYSLHFQHQGCKRRGVKKGKISTQLISVVMLEFWKTSLYGNCFFRRNILLTCSLI